MYEKFNPGFDLLSGYEIEAEEDTRDYNQTGCNFRDYRILYHGTVVHEGTSCSCGRGCSGLDCIRDDWNRHDTDIEEFRK